MRDNSSLYFWFLKSWICTCQTKNYHFGSQRSTSILMMGLCWTSNTGILQKWNTWSNIPYHIPCNNCNAYFLFMENWDACLAVWDSHTYVNWHLRDTWIIWLFLKSFTIEPFLLTSYLFIPLHNYFFYLFRIGSAV